VVIMRKTLLVVSPISVRVSPSCSELLLTNEAPKIDPSRRMWGETNGITKIYIELNLINTDFGFISNLALTSPTRGGRSV
jgi:hypothetical protein